MQQDKNEEANKQAPGENEKAVVQLAHEEADKDMEEDAEFTASSPNDDLDEEESARLGEDDRTIV